MTARRLAAILALTACALALPASPAAAVSSTVVISEVYGGAGCGTAACSTYKNDFIELLNRGTQDVPLAGWSVQYAAATGSSWQVTALPDVTLEPGQYLLVAEGFGNNGLNSLPTPDASGTIAMSATAAKVALVNATTPLTGACPAGSPQIIDFVGYGSTAACYEGAGPALGSNTTTSIQRLAAGCIDTDNNSTDFAPVAPTPQNSSSPRATCATPAGFGRARARQVRGSVRISWSAAPTGDVLRYDVLRLRAGRRVVLRRVWALGSRDRFAVTDRRARRGDRYVIRELRADGSRPAHGPYRVRGRR